MSEALLKLVRLYTFYAPIRKGKYRLYERALKQCSELPESLITKTTDGRTLKANLNNKMFDTVFFLGEYERAISEIISEIVRKEDVCLDVGANFGWYSTLLAKLNVRQVYAFEPVPPIFQDLTKNYELCEKPKNLSLHNLALGDEEKKIELHIFENEPNGHASISTMGKKNYSAYEARMTTFNNFKKENGLGEINFLKVDIEGAELMFLKGATELFAQKTPPMIVMEMALETSRHFGYTPNDLIEFIKSQAEYEFYSIDEYQIKLNKISGFAKEDIGANVLCVPKNQFRERLEKFGI